MKNSFFNSSVGNIYLKPSSNSEVASQILYGEKFKILSKKNDWFKIKTDYDNYIGYIRKKKFYEKFRPTHKIFKLKSRIFISFLGNFLIFLCIFLLFFSIPFLSSKQSA